MTTGGPDFRQTWLWRQAFVNPRSDSTTEEQEFFRMQYLLIRDKAAQLVSRITADLPGMTVHDISHLDALWDTASLVSEGAVNVNPAEAFVLGASILLHDSAMSLAAYPGGIGQVKGTIAWKDAVARLALSEQEEGGVAVDKDNPSEVVVQTVTPDVLRQLHAQQAEVLAEQAWRAPDGGDVYLIDDADLRRFYGPTIGQIAHSHWWSIQKVEHELSEDLGALPQRTRNIVDRIKLACLLRISDALHLDSRRAPRFLRTITNPTGVSALHWSFQERLARPHVELDAVVFTTGQPFGRAEAEAWWLAYDALSGVDRELRDVDLLLQGRGREVLKARRVKGAGSPEVLSRTVQTRGWRPVDARLQVSDVPRIVETLGGAKLYGDDPTVALRELLQNAADAVQARRKFQKRASDWGQITVSIVQREEDYWLVVEDTGIGMSEQVLTGPLLDFGVSFWRSSMAMEEFPGLIASGMQAIGRFGIGFFSVFMLGPVVRVYSRRCDRGQETGRLLEFRGGTSTRPILSPAAGDEVPIDGGTRIEVLLKKHPMKNGGLLIVDAVYTKKKISLSKLVKSLAPNLNVALAVFEETSPEIIARPGDWLEIAEIELVSRLDPLDNASPYAQRISRLLMRPVVDARGAIYGRAFIDPSKYSLSVYSGWITISGLRAGRLHNVQGVLLGEPVTAARDSAQPTATEEALVKWASEQAQLIASFIADDEQQARSAEVVLQCGGDVGALKIIKWGSEWLSRGELADRLQSCSEILISFSGDFEYDEDVDEVHPVQFRESFEQSDNVAIVYEHNGKILRANHFSWPKITTNKFESSTSWVGELVEETIRSIWGEEIERTTEEHVVGEVNFTEITREVTVFRRTEARD